MCVFYGQVAQSCPELTSCLFLGASVAFVPHTSRRRGDPAFFWDQAFPVGSRPFQWIKALLHQSGSGCEEMRQGRLSAPSTCCPWILSSEEAAAHRKPKVKEGLLGKA